MNDVKNEAREFVGEERDEAIEKACAFFGVEDASALSISGFERGAVYGLAKRTVIVAVPKGSARASSARPRGEAARGERERRDDEGRGNQARGSGRDANRRRERGRDGRGRDDSGRGRDDSGRGRDDSGRGRDDSGRGRDDSGRGRDDSTRQREDRGPRGNRERTRRPEAERGASAGPSVGSVVGEVGEIGQFLLGTIERMGLGSFEISESQDGGIIVLQVNGPAGQALSSGQGRTVDALQLLVNQVSARISPDRQRVVIDVEGDAEAREEFLGKLAERVAKRALQTGRPVALDPMNARDRRMIHVALRERDDVATMSEGEGRYRQVVVVPENSDEFEDARARSERAGDQR